MTVTQGIQCCEWCGDEFVPARSDRPQRFCSRPCFRQARHPIAESIAARFWSKVNKNGAPSPHCPERGPCWIWTAYTDRIGYGIFSVFPRRVGAHRWAYENTIGAIKRGFSLDHLCRVPSCVRPSHLEPVTHQTNVLRGVGPTARNAVMTHCKRGHPFTAENTYWSAGSRVCRACRLVRYAYHASRARF